MDELTPIRKQSRWVMGSIGLVLAIFIVALIAWLSSQWNQSQSPPPANERPAAVLNQASRNASETAPCERTNEPIHTSWGEALKDPVRVCNVVLQTPEPFPADLAQFKNLRSLTISKKNLTSLPSNIGDLSSLQALILANNQLTTLPPEINKLTKLESLVLRNNPLQNVPAGIAQLTNLRMLNLQETSLSTTAQAQIKNLLPQTTIIF